MQAACSYARPLHPIKKKKTQSMDKFEILKKLITEGESLTSTISFVPSGRNVIRTYSVYRTSEHEKYQNWMSASQRYIKTYFPSDLSEIQEAVKKLSPSNHKKILGILRAIELMPVEPKKDDKRSGTNITINNTQQFAVNIFMEAVKDELTGKQFKELKEILNEYEKEPEQTKPKMKEKLKNMGNDVLSNIIANILTNPNILGGLM